MTILYADLCPNKVPFAISDSGWLVNIVSILFIFFICCNLIRLIFDVLLLLNNEMKEQILGIKIGIRFASPEAQFVVFDWGYIVDSGLWLSYRPTSPCSLADRYDNPMPESDFCISPHSGTKNFATGFRIWPRNNKINKIDLFITFFYLYLSRYVFTFHKFIKLILLLFFKFEKFGIC